MGKAARRRYERQARYLIRMSYIDPNQFQAAWDKRIMSWLNDIRKQAYEWKAGRQDSGKSLFDIVDRAMWILDRCAAPVRKNHWQHTHDVLAEACCRQIASITDQRLYNSGIFSAQLERSRKLRQYKNTA